MCVCLYMLAWMRACMLRTELLVDLEANHWVPKHPSQNITLMSLRGLPAMLLCFISVTFFLCEAFPKYCI